MKHTAKPESYGSLLEHRSRGVTLEAQQRLQEEGCVVDIKLFSVAVAGEVSA